MKAIISFAIISLLLCSCHSTPQSLEVSPQTSAILPIHLSGRSYFFGPELDSSACKIIAACDCCGSSIFFTDESHFVAAFYCLFDDTYAHGNYRIDGEKVYLSYEGKKVDYLSDVRVLHDSVSGLDSTFQASEYKVETMPHSIDTLTVFTCHGVIGFRSMQIDIGLPATENDPGGKSIDALHNDSILQMMGM